MPHLQSAVNLAALRYSELLSCFCWTPNGCLLLGTTLGRLLLVVNAAPTTVPSKPWGPVMGHDAPGHNALVIYEPASAPKEGNESSGADNGGGTALQPMGAVVQVAVTNLHVVMVMAGGAEGSTATGLGVHGWNS